MIYFQLLLVGVRFFPKFKNDDGVSAKSSFHCLLIRTHLEGRGGGGLQNEYVLYARENYAKNGRPLIKNILQVQYILSNFAVANNTPPLSNLNGVNNIK